MIETLRLIRSWLGRAGTWALSAWLAFFAIAVVVGAVLLSLSISTEQSLRLAGLCLQLLGIAAAAVGIRDMRRMFGKLSFLELVRRWVKAAPRLRPRSINVSLSDGITVGASLSSIELWSCPAPDAPMETRVKALESNLETLRTRLQRAEQKSSELTQSLSSQLHGEIAERKAEGQRLQGRIEAASTDGLHLAAAGAFWLAVGIILSTAPNEILAILHYA